MRFLVHGLRIGMVVALAVVVHLGHRQAAVGNATVPLAAVPIARLQQLLPAVAAVGGRSAAVAGGLTLLDSAGVPVGTLLQTAPEGNVAIGFSGPTNLLLICDNRLKVVGIDLLSSGDTRDHVTAVLRDEAFWQQFVGRPLAALADEKRPPRTTAAATLTSLAIAEAISRRLGGTAGSSRFAEPPTLADLQTIFPTAGRLEADPGEPAVSRLYDAEGIPLGWALRTSPAADTVIGYQGPTDSVICFDASGVVCGLLVLSSYDNEPYVGYVRDDWSFRRLFAGRTFAELAAAEPEAAEVEGVSGATMTSQAVARGVVRAAVAEATRRQDQPRAEFSRLARWVTRIDPPQWGGLGVIVIGLLTGLTRLRGGRFGRLVLPLVVLAYLGFGAGAVLSQAQLWGWAAAGLPRGATVLLFLTAVALATPIATGRNVYCAQLCPHGAAQQLLAKVVRPQRRRWLAPLRRRLAPVLNRLRWLPLGLVAGAFLVTIFDLPLPLVDFEPFDAYLPAVAGGAAIMLFAGSLLASCVVPMAYCRYGCPTGALLDQLRLHGRSDRLSWRDGLLGICLITGVAVVLWREGLHP